MDLSRNPTGGQENWFILSFAAFAALFIWIRLILCLLNSLVVWCQLCLVNRHANRMKLNEEKDSQNVRGEQGEAEHVRGRSKLGGRQNYDSSDEEEDDEECSSNKEGEENDSKSEDRKHAGKDKGEKLGEKWYEANHGAPDRKVQRQTPGSLWSSVERVS